jgi:transcriptional regulator with XRE-family HTH domain
MTNTKMKCDKCGGTGKIESPVLAGSFRRKIRKQYGLTLRAVATKMGVSAAYVSDLELGRRNWSPAVSAQYDNAMRLLNK